MFTAAKKDKSAIGDVWTLGKPGKAFSTFPSLLPDSISLPFPSQEMREGKGKKGLGRDPNKGRHYCFCRPSPLLVINVPRSDHRAVSKFDLFVEPIRSLSEMEPSGVSVEVTKSYTNKDHYQPGTCQGTILHAGPSF